MGKTSLVVGCLLGAMAVMSVSTGAVAQPLPIEEEASEDTATMHEVTLRGASPDVVWSIFPPDGPIEIQKPLARCGERGCTLKMKPGRYRLWVEGADGGGPRGYRSFEVDSDLDLTATAPRRGAKGGGLAMAIVGMAAIPIGMATVMVGAAGDCLGDPSDEEDGNCSSDEDLVTAGIVITLAGIVATPVGWVTFAKARRPTIESTPQSQSSALPPDVRPRRVQFGVRRMGRGFGLGGTVSF